LRFLFLSCLFSGGGVLQATPFVQAPQLGRPARKISEWMRVDQNAEVIKGGVSHFDRQGHLLSYYSDDYLDGEKIERKYDNRGRLVESKGGVGGNQRITEVFYKSGQKIEETTFKNKKYRTIHYEKDGKLIESKYYVKGGELGNAYKLMERKVYNYNKQDSLFGVMQYIHPLKGKSAVQKRKTIHSYDRVHGKRKKTVVYDFDGTPSQTILYTYNTRKQLQLIEYIYHRDKVSYQTYLKYKDGKLWQKITDQGYKKNVEVYKDGRLIRLRSYLNNSLFILVDYQYVFY